jgi:ribonuclease VapC
MVIDSSAIVCILLREPEADRFIQRIAEDGTRLMSTFSILETAVVIEVRKGAAGARALDVLLHEADVTAVPFTAEHLDLARDAYSRFGKGRHPARLNLGDCVSYSLARYSGEPLLFKGQDFAKTDIRSVSTGPEE